MHRSGLLFVAIEPLKTRRVKQLSALHVVTSRRGKGVGRDLQATSECTTIPWWRRSRAVLFPGHKPWESLTFPGHSKGQALARGPLPFCVSCLLSRGVCKPRALHDKPALAAFWIYAHRGQV